MADLIGAAMLKPGDELFSVRSKWPAEASINADGSINYNGRSFATPSAAGGAVCEGRAVNGWDFWAVRRDGVLRSLSELRSEYEPDGGASDELITPAVAVSIPEAAGDEADENDDAPDPSDIEPAPLPAEDAAESPGLITSFGMFWRREQVNWNSGGRIRLLGYKAGEGQMVNFADQVGVYLLHDGARTVYVGRVSKPRMAPRLQEHTKDRLSGRWDRFSWFGLRPVLTKGVLGEAAQTFGTDLVVATMEAILIEGLEPPQNRRQGDGMTGQEYQQAIDEQLQERTAMATMLRVFQERSQP